MPLYRQYTSITVAKSFKPRSYALFKASPMRKALIIDEKIQKKRKNAHKSSKKEQFCTGGETLTGESPFTYGISFAGAHIQSFIVPEECVFVTASSAFHSPILDLMNF